MSAPRLVRQEHTNGCVIASLAMVMGKTYREIAEDLCPKVGKWVYPKEGKVAMWQDGIDLSADGVCFHGEGITYLVENGYAVQTKYKFLWGNKPRAVWPVEPWAEMHIMCVQTSQSHATVLLRDGTVLDPLHEAARQLSDYAAIDSITAVWKVEGRGDDLR